jgi:hypothetical protein
MLTAANHVLKLLADQDVDMAAMMTGRMFNLPKSTIARVLEVSLPIIAERAGHNPELLRRLYATHLPTLPALPREFYARMVENTEVRQAIMDDFKATFGSMLDGVAREAARQAGTTDGQAREVLAATLPAVTWALGKANADGTLGGFAQQLRELSLPIQGDSTMTMSKTNLDQVMMDAAVETSVNMTAQMLGLPKETVIKILKVGLPMMARMANENPELLKALYGQSVKMLPESMQAFYAKLAENPEAQQKMVDDFKAMVGPMMESLSRDAAREAGTTEAEARTALATTYPAVADALRREAPDTSEQGFGQRLKNLAA